MRIDLYKPTWNHGPSLKLQGIEEVLAGVWREAAVAYAADWAAQRALGKRGPVGVQRYLNQVLDRRFRSFGWEAHSSTYTRDRLWLRTTFRHQMSAGSNVIDALKAVARGGYTSAVIAAATRDFLELISPADAPSLTSFEKLRAEVTDLDGVVSAAIYLAALRPNTGLTGHILGVLRSSDRSRPG